MRARTWTPRTGHQSLGDRQHRAAGDVHGSARHQRRQRRAAAHRRQPVGQRRRSHLGADGVSRRQRDRAAAQRVVLDAVRPEALLHGVRGDLHHQLAALRRRADAGLADLLPHPAGPGRRRAAADLAGHPGRELPAREAGRRDGVLRHGRGRGAGDRADAGRLDHRQLHLALDLPDQHPGRHPFARR